MILAAFKAAAEADAAAMVTEAEDEDESEEEEILRTHDRWSYRHGAFFASSKTTDKLAPGVYDIGRSDEGIYFLPVGGRDDELLLFPGSVINEVVEQIETFWEREAIFRRYELPFRRGILLYGPPGSGKSSTARLISDNVVKKGGVVFLFNRPDYFMSGYRLFRRIQPDTPVVVVMEDLDAIFDQFPESAVLNMLDGVESVDKTVFLATTNFMEKLSERVTNRPSRFDRRYKVPHPQPEARRMYFESLLRDGDEIPDLERWVKDSHGLSLAHLKEMFVGVVLLGDTYDEVLAAMNNMREKAHSANDGEEFFEVRRGQYW